MIRQLSQEVLIAQGNLSFEQWDAKIKYRGLDFKYPKQLDEAAQCYERKIPLIEEQLFRIAAAKTRPDLFPEIPIDSEQSLIEKLARLKEKYACVLKEQEFRKDKKVSRKLHGTVYYIDLDGGNDGDTGVDTGHAWLTIEKYTTTTVRSAGDIAWVRANTDETPASYIFFDEKGTINNYIEIRGCSATAGEDPWSDGSAIKPIFDFNNAVYAFLLDSDNYWRLYRLEVRNNNLANGLISINNCYGITLDSLYIHDNSNAAGKGIGITYGIGVLILNSAISDCKIHDLYCSTSTVKVKNTTFDGGGNQSSDYGLFAQASVVEMDSCQFGVTTVHDVASIIIQNYFALVRLLNCKLSNATEVTFYTTDLTSCILSEDHDQVKGAQKAYYYVGTVERDSGVQLDSLDSAKMSPNSNCGTVQALTLSGNPLQGDYQIWCPASETTITIVARETAAWAADPDNTEFYFEASYLDEAATSAHRATQASAQGLSGTDEISFTMTFTPAQAGWVYVTCYLKKYESGKYVNVSVKPTVS